MENLNKYINKHIDHTNINPEATEEDIRKSCQEAKEYNFRGVCVNPKWTKTAAEELVGSEVKLTTLIDPPMGDSSTKERVKMGEQAKKDGSQEIDVVVGVSDVKHGNYDKVLADLKAVCAVLPTKVIIGSGYLTDSEIKKVSALVKEAGAICVKTSTYADPLDHFELLEKARHLKLMRDAAPGLLIKAAGNIRTYDDAKMMIEAGADILGTSSSVQIMEESKKRGEE